MCGWKQTKSFRKHIPQSQQKVHSELNIGNIRLSVTMHFDYINFRIRVTRNDEILEYLGAKIFKIIIKLAIANYLLHQTF